VPCALLVFAPPSQALIASFTPELATLAGPIFDTLIRLWSDMVADTLADGSVDDESALSAEGLISTLSALMYGLQVWGRVCAQKSPLALSHEVTARGRHAILPPCHL
jgi:hypothetical protein